MLEAERHRLIAKIVQERSVVAIAELVEMLGASEATVRRDVNAMAEAGRLRRIRGGAESLTPRHEAHLVGMPFELSRDIAVTQKRAIAREAAALIQDGDSIIIGGGTTTFALVEFLRHRQLDILTNSMPIVSQLFATSRNRLMIPGGTLFREQNIVLNPYDQDATEHFWGQKLFSSCYGLSRYGLTETDPLIVQAQTKLLKRADELVVLADSRKFRQHSSMVVAPLERISTLITDSGTTSQQLEPFRASGVRIIVADVPSEEDGPADTRATE